MRCFINSDNFTQKLKAIREKLVLSQEDLGREIGVSFATINRWENGKTKPSRLALNQLKMYLAKQVANGNLLEQENIQ
ncbi:MAG: helix-turn-helix transcriptional regulator [Planctomycetes bacterium]|nr:helix-turn-helix transcriptional regulator [Planctomycetota bacterium]